MASFPAAMAQARGERFLCEMAQDAAAQPTWMWPVMTQRKKSPARNSTKLKAAGPAIVSAKSADEDVTKAAFNIWLERGLHKIFDDVAKEPIPPELLQLIEGDRQKSKDDEAP